MLKRLVLMRFVRENKYSYDTLNRKAQLK